MEFGSNKEGFCEEDQVSNKVKLHNYFSYASSSSSSHHQCKTQQLLPVLNNISRWEMEETNTTHQIYDDHQQQIYSNEETAAAASTTSPRNSEDYVRSASAVGIEKEHMFDKVVTPSDVGKLNRLVIPKQHAEKYFPLDSSTNEKGLLLNFEDRNGKPWRFRYSYWNSSQSYVMTKGWSRFVKDKKLDAGDVVSFQRGVGELGKDRLFIDWRRRPDASDPAATSFPLHQHQLPFHPSIPWNPLMVMRPQVLPSMARDHSQSNNFYNRNSYYNGSSYGSSTTAMSPCYGSSTNVMSPRSMGSVFYWRSQPAAATSVHPQPHMGMVEWQRQQQHQLQQQQHPIVFDSVPVVQGQAAAKRLRLFGVNMDCPVTESDECDILSSTMASQPSQLSSSSQLRLYNGTPMPAALPPIDFLNKGKASMSFDSGI